MTIEYRMSQRCMQKGHDFFEGVRALLFPRLARAYAAWRAGDQGAALRSAVSAGTAHWGRACEQLLEIHRTQGDQAPAAIERRAQSPDWVLG